MKRYIKPETTATEIQTVQTILAGSGVTDGSTVGDEFNDEDKTYSRKTFSV